MDTYIVELIIALALGMILGLERSFAGKNAGMRTYGLVSLGSALFVVISSGLIERMGPLYGIDPTRMAANVIVGIGFLGAGLIITQSEKVRGLTTAAGLWVSAAVGIASGFGMYPTAITATCLAIITFTLFATLEKKLRQKFPLYHQDEE